MNAPADSPAPTKVLSISVANKEIKLGRTFSCEFCEISKNTFFTEYLRTTASAHLAVQIFTVTYVEYFVNS